jgi:WhiB family redox-sensing transcriptional regulator
VSIFGELFAIPDQPWVRDAVCATADPEAWHPPTGHSTLPARLICVDCPARKECLRWALEHNETEGVWGGYSPRQRQRLRRGERVELPTRPERGEPLECARCGVGFEATHGTAKYCSRYCSKNAQTERQQKKRQALREQAA